MSKPPKYKLVTITARTAGRKKQLVEIKMAHSANEEWVKWGVWQLYTATDRDHPDLKFTPDDDHPVIDPDTNIKYNSALPYICLRPNSRRENPHDYTNFHPLDFKSYETRQVHPPAWTKLTSARVAAVVESNTPIEVTKATTTAIINTLMENNTPTEVAKATTTAIINTADAMKDIFLLKLEGLMNYGFTELEAIEMLGTLKKKQGQSK